MLWKRGLAARTLALILSVRVRFLNRIHTETNFWFDPVSDQDESDDEDSEEEDESIFEERGEEGFHSLLQEHQRNRIREPT